MYQSRFVEVTHDISVEVNPTYLQEESNPVGGKHIFAYFISIQNMGDRPVTLLRRYWEIKDNKGGAHQIEGEGVIGRTPTIVPDSEHSYNSFCMLKTYRGSMVGYYRMETTDGEMLRVRIPHFLLVSPLLN